MQAIAKLQGFNSILVRLKVREVVEANPKADRFQFHTGSIKSPQRLLHENLIAVSIPYWFD